MTFLHRRQLEAIASQLDSDPERLPTALNERIAELERQPNEPDADLHPEPNLLELEDAATTIGRQMEQVIADMIATQPCRIASPPVCSASSVTATLISAAGNGGCSPTLTALHESREQGPPMRCSPG